MFSYNNFFLQVPNNYETDLIFPIIEKASEMANVCYALSDEPTKTKLKVWYKCVISLTSFLICHFFICLFTQIVFLTDNW